MSDSSILRCVIITPESQAVDAEAIDVVLPVHDGLWGVLPGHAPFLCKLGAGLLRYRDLQNRVHAVFLEEGFGHIRDNEVSILTPNAITEDDIDAVEAREQLLQAQAMPMATIEEVQIRSEAIQRAKYLKQLTSVD